MGCFFPCQLVENCLLIVIKSVLLLYSYLILLSVKGTSMYSDKNNFIHLFSYKDVVDVAVSLSCPKFLSF